MKTKFSRVINIILIILSMLLGIIVSWLIKDIVTSLVLSGKGFENRSLFVQTGILAFLTIFISAFLFVIFSVIKSSTSLDEKLQQLIKEIISFRYSQPLLIGSINESVNIRRAIASILTVGACIFSIEQIILLLYTNKASVPDEALVTRLFIFGINSFLPEPGEQRLYVASVLALPFLCAGFYLLFTRLLSSFNGNLIKFHLYLSITATVLVFSLAFVGLLNVENLYLAPSSLVLKPLLTLVFCAAIPITSVIISKSFGWKQLFANRLVDFVYLLAVIGLTLMLVMETTFNERDLFVPGYHFVPYFDSVVQVYLGKTLLVNDTAQYGLYALLLKPIFQLIGLSVFKFTLFMGILKGLGFLCLLFLLRYATKNRWIAFAGFASLAFYNRLRVPVDIVKDPYFQYMPHRFFFPTVFLLLVWFYLNEKKIIRKNILYFFIPFFCALSILWNPDSGLVILITWLICLAYTEMLLFTKRNIKEILTNILKPCLVIGSALILTFMSFYLYTYFFSGEWPHLSGILDYQKFFIVYGFGMLPITQIVHPWNMFAIIYVIGVFIGVRYFMESTQIVHTTSGADEKEVNILILVISILGIGLFSYYMGRSHDLNLIGPSWPILLLLTIFTDRLFSGILQVSGGSSFKSALETYLASPQLYYKIFIFVILFCFLSSSILSIAIHFPFLQALMSERTSGIKSGMPDTLRSQIEFIQTNSQPDDPVLILSDYAPELYLYTNHQRPLPVPGFNNDLIFKSDLEKIITFLKMPPAHAKIFWDPTFTMITLINPNQFSSDLTLVASSNGLFLYDKK